MSASGDGRWCGEPFVVGAKEEFAAVRAFLERIGFTEAGICAGAEISNTSELPTLSERKVGFLSPDTPLSLAVQLFLDGADLPWGTVRNVLGPSDLAVLQMLGLVQELPENPWQCVASVSLYPIERLYLASDRHTRIQLFATGIPADLVYSALTPETRRFVDLMPRIPCADYLELCSGTGIAALVAAREFADRAWAVDITARSTRFAAFNAALNGIANFRALEGDLYTPVAGQTFDLITAHPPYVPSFETAMVFRDGGEDGEQITRKMLAGLADHLRPGGQFYCDCMMTDRDGAPLERRIREMLGPVHDEFDVLLGQTRLIDPEELLAGGVRSGRSTAESAAVQRALFLRLGVEHFVNATFLVQRRRSSRTVVTRRRILSAETRSAHLQWFLNWAASIADWERGSSRFLDARPRSTPHTELLSRSALRDGRWSVTASSLTTHVPFSVEAECPSWFATFLTWCDGQTTARDLLARLRNAGIVPDSAADADFAILIGELAEGGFVELDLFPMPREPAEQEEPPSIPVDGRMPSNKGVFVA
jgi:methylase of polypeptide subunit release factors